MTWTDDKMTIRGEEIPVRRGELSIYDLKYYRDNPRIYSIVRPEEQEPEQDEIQDRLQKMEHVKVLIQDIKVNGGLFDPIIVRDGTFEVLEGNSRLAAYRRLAENDLIRWGKIPCVLLPETIGESQVFAILGQYHIIGKKDWAPYEQAGFLYRRIVIHRINRQQVVTEVGLRKSEVDLLVRTYQFMLDNKDNNINRWSYYYEYLKSRKIGQLRHEHEDFDQALIAKIKSGEFNKAADVRDLLPKLVSPRKASKRVVKRFIRGEITLEQAVELFDYSGSSNAVYQRLNRFRTWLVTPETRRHMRNSVNAVKQRIKFELGKIEREMRHLLNEFEGT